MTEGQGEFLGYVAWTMHWIWGHINRGRAPKRGGDWLMVSGKTGLYLEPS